MKKFKYLSYFLNPKTPLYGGGKGIEITINDSILKGDTANTKILKFHNHSGTHIDFPNHFIEDGKKSSDYNADFWIFNYPYILDIPKKKSEIITIDDIDINKIPKNTDFLILNTGFYKIRHKSDFWKFNPGVHPDVSFHLKNFFPELRVLGMDFISLTSFQNRVLGRESHKSFLGKNNILLVEDINLNNIDTQPKKIFCFPLLVESVDGSPVTIIAEI